MLNIHIGNVLVGDGAPVRVNCNVGCNSLAEYQVESGKIIKIKDADLIPDFMMDLSLVRLEYPLYKNIIDFLNIPVGTVLSYIPFNKGVGLSWGEVKKYLLQICKEGISFVTIHFTADADLLDIAKQTRKIACTSRGGAMVLYDTIKNNRKCNIYREHIDEIATIAKRNHLVISLGTAFRASNIFDACDEVHLEETKRQLAVCMYLQDKGVEVMVENIGHIGLNKLEEHTQLLREFNAPIMPLGPMVCDNAVGEDHIVAAIGGTLGGYWGAAHILNCVTRYEHSESRITEEVMLEAIRTAKIAAHCINLSKGIKDDWEMERIINEQREKEKSCIVGVRCVRCKDVCPLKFV